MTSAPVVTVVADAELVLPGDEDYVADTEYDEIYDVLQIMKQQETTVYYRESSTDELVSLWRKMLVGWMYYVVDYCRLQRQSVAAAAFFYDVAITNNLVETREQHQLAAATSLQLSLKTFDTAVISADKLVQLGRGLFTKDDIVNMEMKILLLMNWRTHPTSTYCFLRQYERLLPTSVPDSARHTLEEITKLISELTVSEIKYNDHLCSHIAYGAMLLALELVDCDDLSISERQCFVVRMNKVAGLQSNDTKVLEVFESLKQTVEDSDKLPGLIESLNEASRTKKGESARSKVVKSNSRSSSSRRTRRRPRSNSASIKKSIRIQSPRHVMQRIGSAASLGR